MYFHLFVVNSEMILLFAAQLLLWFPMWGGVVFPAKKGATEEDYYFSGKSQILQGRQPFCTAPIQDETNERNMQKAQTHIEVIHSLLTCYFPCRMD